jgi:hypothetical protein
VEIGSEREKEGSDLNGKGFDFGSGGDVELERGTIEFGDEIEAESAQGIQRAALTSR